MRFKRLREKRSGMNNKGFTLIEIAVVLVIIGLIIGATVKGKDLVQSAKQKKFYTNFLKAWELTVISYYDRTGFVLGDGSANAGTNNPPDGVFDNVNGNTFSNNNGVDDKLKAIGLSVPTTNTSSSGMITFKGKKSGTVTMTLYLQYVLSKVDNNSNNALYITSMPTDLAIALDGMVDGRLGAKSGRFRQAPDDAAPNDGNWPDVATTPVVPVQYIINVP
ncbi:MAG: hypothetical protein CSA29_00655 [Desulfobacterales bacterium]|nr:MAG: hypothetical protein CSA29_00655 [Desulfobacterales bacterium]